MAVIMSSVSFANDAFAEREKRKTKDQINKERSIANRSFNMMKSKDIDKKVNGIITFERVSKTRYPTIKESRMISNMFDDNDKRVRLQAIKSMGGMAKGSARINAMLSTPKLIKLLKDSDPDIRNAAATSLEKMGSDSGAREAKKYRKRTARKENKAFRSKLNALP